MVNRIQNETVNRRLSGGSCFARGLKYTLIGLLALAAILLVAGLVYQSTGEAADATRYPPPGELIQVSSQRMHINCQGEGSPAIILETLHGGTSANWAWIQPELAKKTQVCAYDRAGRGWSDPGAPALDLWGTAENLHNLLQLAEIEEPYILVGHSIGGLYVRAYAQQYPQETTGVVLLDSSHPEQYDRYPELRDITYERMAATFPALARVGLFRFYFAQGGEIDFQDLPPRQHDELTAFWSSTKYHQSVQSENQVTPLIYEQAHDLSSLGDTPLVVISADIHPPGWELLQVDLASLSTNSQQVTIPGASHSSLALNQAHAHQTSELILQLFEQVSKQTR